MEAFAAFVLGLGMMAAAQDAAYRAAHVHYYPAPTVYAEARYRPTVVYAPAPSQLPAATPVAYAPPPPARSAESSEQFIRNWQNFMEPAARR